jgi:hypothetical protein
MTGGVTSGVDSGTSSGANSDKWLDVRCLRCGGGFECGANAGHCDCFDIHLTDALRAELSARYSDCLCLRCLRDVMAGANPDPVQPAIGSVNASG